MTQTSNQKELIINHLMTRGPLTVLEAIQYIDCYALSQRAGELIQEGYNIQKRWKKTSTGKNVMEYYLK
jgi:hypothetical protein